MSFCFSRQLLYSRFLHIYLIMLYNITKKSKCLCSADSLAPHERLLFLTLWLGSIVRTLKLYLETAINLVDYE